MHTRLAMGTALRPVAPINGLIFFFENILTTFTPKIPPEMDRAKAKKPPITMPIVVQLRKASLVIVAPTLNPKKMVAVFMMVAMRVFMAVFFIAFFMMVF